ncbi:MAG: DUF4197 domain-containing protein [Thalassobaculales bacterium]
MRPIPPAAALALLALMAAMAQPVKAQSLQDLGRGLLQQPGQGRTVPGQAAPAGGYTDAQADGALREALKLGAQRTVGRVGRSDGYLKDPAIKVPLPGFLATARSGLAMAGASGLLDDLETRMNRAAEQAAPKALDIVTDAITRMTVSDARGIITGPKDAATQYLKRTTGQPLASAFRPVVDRTLSDAGAVQAYAAATRSIGGGALGALGGAAGGGSAGFDLTGFVVEKALDGLFHYIAAEEAAIRSNPAARSTELLKSVFGR